MKKTKKTTSSSQKSKKEEKRLVRALIPLLSKKEDSEELIARACREADELIALLIVDTNAMPGQFGFAASDIGHGNSLMQEIKRIALEYGKECQDIIEWGETTSKIIHLVQLRNINKVFLLKQDNQLFKNLVKELEENTKAEVEVIKAQEFGKEM